MQSRAKISFLKLYQIGRIYINRNKFHFYAIFFSSPLSLLVFFLLRRPNKLDSEFKSKIYIYTRGEFNGKRK